MAAAAGGYPPHGPGFSLTYAAIETVARRWSETGDVVAQAQSGLPAPGGWAPGLAARVSRFVEAWQRDLTASAATAESVRTRLDETVASARRVDGSAAALANNVTGPPNACFPPTLTGRFPLPGAAFPPDGAFPVGAGSFPAPQTDHPGLLQ